MKTVLQINASLFSNAGQSSQLADQFVNAWRATNEGAVVLSRDLSRDPIPHLTGDGFLAFAAEPEARTAAQQAVVDLSDALIDELRRADVVVIGLPMYNLGIPSTLKAYFDHVARARVTFRYTNEGPVGMLGGKKVYVLATRGGQYAGTSKDSQIGYVKDFLALLGMNDVDVIFAEGMGMGDAVKQTSLGRAKDTIAKLASTAAVSAAA